MKRGGFHCVIGNPPYVLLQDEFRDDMQLAYFKSKYQVASYKVDTYHLFIERAVRLTAREGRCSMITPSNYLTNNFLKPLRRFLLSETQVESILLPNFPVFPGVSVDTAVFAALRCKDAKAEPIRLLRFSSPGEIDQTTPVLLDPAEVSARPGAILTGEGSAMILALLERLEQSNVPLSSFATVNFGKQLRNRKIYTEDVITVSNENEIPDTHIACLTGSDISRYLVRWGHLACLRSEEARSGGCWDEDVHSAKGKLICRQIGKRPFFGFDIHGFHCLNTVFMVRILRGSADPRFVLGCLNSRLIGWFWEQRYYDRRNTFPKIKGTYLKQLPVRPINSDDPADAARHDKMVALVDRMLDLHKKLVSEKNPETRKHLKTLIDTTDRQIDCLVYDLYDLTSAEIETVE